MAYEAADLFEEGYDKASFLALYNLKYAKMTAQELIEQFEAGLRGVGYEFPDYWEFEEEYLFHD